jgi:hypothetical protein
MTKQLEVAAITGDFESILLKYSKIVSLSKIDRVK